MREVAALREGADEVLQCPETAKLLDARDADFRNFIRAELHRAGLPGFEEVLQLAHGKRVGQPLHITVAIFIDERGGQLLILAEGTLPLDTGAPAACKEIFALLTGKLFAVVARGPPSAHEESREDDEQRNREIRDQPVAAQPALAFRHNGLLAANLPQDAMLARIVARGSLCHAVNFNPKRKT